MADFGDHTYVKIIILQLNIKRSQPFHVDFMISLHNLGDRESEKPKRFLCTGWLLEIIKVKVGSILRIFVFSGMAKVRSQSVHIDVFHFLWCISMIYQSLWRKLMWLCCLLNIICLKVSLLAKSQFLLKIPSNFNSHNWRMSHQNLKKISGI